MLNEFENISFPILIKDGYNLDVVYKANDFFSDPDYYYHKYDSNVELIDSNGVVWGWKYDSPNKKNIPDKIKKTIFPEELKKIILDSFTKPKSKEKINNLLNNVLKIEEMIDKISDIL